MRHAAVVILVGLVVLSGTGLAAGSGVVVPAAAPVPIRGYLEPLPALDGIDDLVVEELHRWGVPGVAVGVLVDGRVAMVRGYGWRHVERRLPVTPDTVFPVGSVTKPITATSLALLVDTGSLEWDRPVVEQLPGFELADPEATARTTLRDLLTHRIGLPRHDLFWYGASLDRDELVRRLRFLPPSRPFRSAFQYQSLSYVVAGRLAGHVTGASWEEALRRQLLEPLGMRRTSASVGALPADENVAAAYATTGRSLRRIPYRNVDAVAPALGINSSVNDLLAFATLHLEEGWLDDRRLLDPDTLRELHSPQIDMGPAGDDTTGRQYAVGWVASRDEGRRILSHEGGVDGFRALLSLLPDEEIGVVVLANSSADHDLVQNLGDELRQRLLGGRGNSAGGPGHRRATAHQTRPTRTPERLQDSVEGSAPPSPWRGTPELPAGAYTGNFEHPAYGAVGVWMRDGRLELLFHGLDLQLESVRAGTSRIADAQPFAGMSVWFGVDRTGAVDRIGLPLEPSVEPIVFRRAPSSWSREPSFLRDFVGRYRLEGAELYVSLDDDALRLTVAGADSWDLVPLDQTTFDVHGLDGTSVEFRRDGAGNVEGMAVRQTHATLVAERR